MNQLFYGSIDVTALLDNLKNKHSAFTKGANGKIYASANVWLNAEVDRFGNIMSLQINPSKEMKDREEKVYIGNFKKSEGSKPVSDKDLDGVDKDYDVPERNVNSGDFSNEIAKAENQKDDLPF